MEKKKNKHVLVWNLLFVAVCGGIFFFLWNAPPETTAHLPHDSQHNRFLKIDKKEAETHCSECHGEGKMPFPKEHPPPYRCLFCHKRN